MLIIDLEDIHEVNDLAITLVVLSNIIYQHEKTVSELVSRIRNNARRYTLLFSEAVDKIMPTPTKDISEHDEVIDVILHQRRERNEQMDPLQEGFPSHLMRR
jgi:DNA replication licensing factor MCM7